MVEIGTNVLIFLSIAFVGTISTILYMINLKGKLKVQKEVPNGVKKTSKEGQEDFVEELRESASEALAFKETQITSLKGEIKSLTGQNAKLKGLLYGTADPQQIAAIEQDHMQLETPRGKKSRGGSVPDEVVEMRLRLMGEKLKINPALLKFDVVGEALRDIAASPEFDSIAAAVLSSPTQPAAISKTPDPL